jgi:hypothetical protein
VSRPALLLSNVECCGDGGVTLEDLRNGASGGATDLEGSTEATAAAAVGGGGGGSVRGWIENPKLWTLCVLSGDSALNID